MNFLKNFVVLHPFYLKFGHTFKAFLRILDVHPIWTAKIKILHSFTPLLTFS